MLQRTNGNMIGMAVGGERFDANRLAELLGHWAGGSGSLYRSLAGGLRLLLQAGTLPSGSRLPAERELARVLSVSRSTAVAAYELLKAEGLLEGRQGSGTYVRGPGFEAGA